jgi:hypothetical protein
MTVSNGGWVVLGDPSGAATLLGLLTAKSPLTTAAAPSLASAGISADAGVTPGLASTSLIPNPQSPIPGSIVGVLTAGQAGHQPQVGRGTQAGGAAAVPEPGTLALLAAAALCGLGVRLRKRKS